MAAHLEAGARAEMKPALDDKAELERFEIYVCKKHRPKGAETLYRIPKNDPDLQIRYCQVWHCLNPPIYAIDVTIQP